MKSDYWSSPSQDKEKFEKTEEQEKQDLSIDQWKTVRSKKQETVEILEKEIKQMKDHEKIAFEAANMKALIEVQKKIVIELKKKLTLQKKFRDQPDVVLDFENELLDAENRLEQSKNDKKKMEEEKTAKNITEAMKRKREKPKKGKEVTLKKNLSLKKQKSNTEQMSLIREDEQRNKEILDAEKENEEEAAKEIKRVEEEKEMNSSASRELRMEMNIDDEFSDDGEILRMIEIQESEKKRRLEKVALLKACIVKTNESGELTSNDELDQLLQEVVEGDEELERIKTLKNRRDSASAAALVEVRVEPEDGIENLESEVIEIDVTPEKKEEKHHEVIDVDITPVKVHQVVDVDSSDSEEDEEVILESVLEQVRYISDSDDEEDLDEDWKKERKDITYQVNLAKIQNKMTSETPMFEKEFGLMKKRWRRKPYDKAVIVSMGPPEKSIWLCGEEVAKKMEENRVLKEERKRNLKVTVANKRKEVGELSPKSKKSRKKDKKPRMDGAELTEDKVVEVEQVEEVNVSEEIEPVEEVNVIEEVEPVEEVNVPADVAEQPVEDLSRSGDDKVVKKKKKKKRSSSKKPISGEDPGEGASGTKVEDDPGGAGQDAGSLEVKVVLEPGDDEHGGKVEDDDIVMGNGDVGSDQCPFVEIDPLGASGNDFNVDDDDLNDNLTSLNSSIQSSKSLLESADDFLDSSIDKKIKTVLDSITDNVMTGDSNLEVASGTEANSNPDTSTDQSKAGVDSSNQDDAKVKTAGSATKGNEPNPLLSNSGLAVQGSIVIADVATPVAGAMVCVREGVEDVGAGVPGELEPVRGEMRQTGDHCQ